MVNGGNCIEEKTKRQLMEVNLLDGELLESVSKG